MSFSGKHQTTHSSFTSIYSWKSKTWAWAEIHEFHFAIDLLAAVRHNDPQVSWEKLVSLAHQVR